MTFFEAIEGLYSGNIFRICEILNSGSHISQLTGCEKFLFVHTGFYCQVQTGSIFEVLYRVNDKKIFYLKWNTSSFAPIGLPIIIDTNSMPLQKKPYGKNEWYYQYNVNHESFSVALVKDINEKNKRISSLILADKFNTEITQFSIFNNGKIIKKYPLNIENIPRLYLGFYKFRPNIPLLYYNDIYYIDNDLDDYGKSYKKYNGYNGWSDDVIDDAFGGIPEATWNVD